MMPSDSGSPQQFGSSADAGHLHGDTGILPSPQDGPPLPITDGDDGISSGPGGSRATDGKHTDSSMQREMGPIVAAPAGLDAAGDAVSAPRRALGIKARRERYLIRLLAPTGRSVRHMQYLGKWVLLGVCIGVVAGIGAIVFYEAIVTATALFQGGIAGYVPPGPAGEGRSVVIPGSRYWLFPVSTALGGLLAGAIVLRFAPEAEGHGTDAAIACFHEHDGQMHPRVPLIKLLTAAITLGSGGSAGREGPTAQISAGFGSFLGRLLRLDAQDRRIAVATGIGAGIGAIFRAPLGGAVLSAELLYRRDFEPEALAPALVASIVGYTMFSAIFGWIPVFGNQPGLLFTQPLQLLYYAALGGVIGVIGILYIKVFYGLRRLFGWLRISPYLKPALGGLLVGFIGLAVPQAAGVGYGWVQFMMLPTQTAVPLLIIVALPFLKILTTSLSISSGGSGGIFGPGLVIGAGVGAAFWGGFHTFLPGLGPTPAPFVVVAMMSLFGSVAHAPIAMMLMVGEMTGSYGLLAPAMITISIASVVVGDRTIYTSQPATRADSPAHRLSFTFPLLRALRVREAMSAPLLVVQPDIPLAEARRQMEAISISEAAVAEPDGTLIGLLTSVAVTQEMLRGGATVRTTPMMIARIESADTLDTALSILAQSGVQRLPVVDTDTPDRLAGILTIDGIARAYARHSGSDIRRLGAMMPGAIMHDVTLTAGQRAVGRSLRDLNLPEDALIVSIQRDGSTIIPRGQTILAAGDNLVVITTPDTAIVVENTLRM